MCNTAGIFHAAIILVMEQHHFLVEHTVPANSVDFTTLGNNVA